MISTTGNTLVVVIHGSEKEIAYAKLSIKAARGNFMSYNSGLLRFKRMHNATFLKTAPNLQGWSKN